MKAALTSLLNVACCAVILAADPPAAPHKAAADRYEREKASLDTAYQKELASIQKTYAAALNGLRKEALDRKDIEEVQRLADEIKGLEMIDQLPPGKLTAKDFAGKKFRLGIVQHGEPVEFLKNGTIVGNMNPPAHQWKLVNGRLVLTGNAGPNTPTSWFAAKPVKALCFEGTSFAADRAAAGVILPERKTAFLHEVP